jgi:hypothetical protein
MRDLHNNIDAERIIAPQAKTTIAATLGKVIDLKGYEGCEIIIDYGTITASPRRSRRSSRTAMSPARWPRSPTPICSAPKRAPASPRPHAHVERQQERHQADRLYRHQALLTCEVVSTVTAATIIAVTSIKHTPSRAAGRDLI